ncbi:MOSC domain-containing protein [Eudoraea sp.]|uniref:MOSC domain-containing protein n=1 Tax=Eudoraea sp. TaxID=1979955 RepID=UPI003C787E61
MRVISTNIGPLTKVNWHGKEIVTGIFKKPIDEPLMLQTDSVANDSIADPRVHGGQYKACYLFSSKYYNYWKRKYPHLEWGWGMFGENLTIEHLEERELRIGDIYEIGTALIQITQPREPCFKLGIRFGTQEILKEFIAHGHPGTYVKVLKKGIVKKGDPLILKEKSKSPLTIQDFYRLLFEEKKNKDHLALAIANPCIPEKKRNRLKNYV